MRRNGSVKPPTLYLICRWIISSEHAGFSDYAAFPSFLMAPMTRSRAKFDCTPGELAVEYYSQRASVGLIVTEGTQPSDDGQGYLTTPGIYRPAHVGGMADQVTAWTRRTMVYRSSEANSGGSGQSAESAGH
jgi:NADH:flavin oxidoreductase / NADH oxidase family